MIVSYRMPIVLLSRYLILLAIGLLCIGCSDKKITLTDETGQHKLTYDMSKGFVHQAKTVDDIAVVMWGAAEVMRVATSNKDVVILQALEMSYKQEGIRGLEKVVVEYRYNEITHSNPRRSDKISRDNDSTYKYFIDFIFECVPGIVWLFIAIVWLFIACVIFVLFKYVVRRVENNRFIRHGMTDAESRIAKIVDIAKETAIDDAAASKVMEEKYRRLEMKLKELKIAAQESVFKKRSPREFDKLDITFDANDDAEAASLFRPTSRKTVADGESKARPAAEEPAPDDTEQRKLRIVAKHAMESIVSQRKTGATNYAEAKLNWNKKAIEKFGEDASDYLNDAWDIAVVKVDELAGQSSRGRKITPKQVNESVVNVKRGLKDLGLTIRDIFKMDIQDRENVLEIMTDRLIEQTGLNSYEAGMILVEFNVAYANAINRYANRIKLNAKRRQQRTATKEMISALKRHDYNHDFARRAFAKARGLKEISPDRPYLGYRHPGILEELKRLWCIFNQERY